MTETPKAFLVKIHLAKGHDHFWDVIRELDKEGSWSTSAIHRHSDVDLHTVRDFVKRLLSAGFVKITGEMQPRNTNGWENLYRIVKNQRTTPRIRRDGTLLPEKINETLWRTMKIIKRFSVAELIDAASTDVREIKNVTAKSYIKHLMRVGVLRRTGSAGEKNATYILAKNLGAYAPQILKTLLVFDPNSHKIIGADDAREVSND